MIYFYDGTAECFLTAFLAAYADENALLTSVNAQLVLGQQTVFVQPNAEKAEKCRRRLLSFDPDCMKDLDLLLRSGEPQKDMIAFRYFKLIAREKAPVRKMLSEGDVIAAVECVRRVTYEVHRFHGFLRFMESASGALYAPFSPDHDICDLLLPHFRARLSKFSFVIHDVKRKKAAVYDGEHSFTAPLQKAEILLSADEQDWRALGKNYYESVNIPSRERLKQMRGYMPVRYWKFLSELN